MCELFAMSSRVPATVSLSMDEFARHGGLTGPHADGWGIAFYDVRDVRLIKEPEAAADSPWLQFLKDHEISSTTVISHIRQATKGERRLSNTHPFAREMAGRMHVFAHNGTLSGAEDLTPGRSKPVGDTDSERAFCHLLGRLEPLWSDGAPSLDTRIDAVTAFAADMRSRGPANFVYSDGECLYLHGHRRKCANGTIEPPGLYILCRHCVSGGNVVEAAGLSVEDSDQDIALAASVPLTEEAWDPLAEGEIVVLSRGRVVERRLA